MNRPRLSVSVATAAVIALSIAAAPTASASVPTAPSDGGGAVFVQTDDPHGNAVIAYHRAPDGTLARAGSYRTDGDGADAAGSVVDPLASQGSLTLDRSRGLLLVVNGGSNTLTVFGVQGAGSIGARSYRPGATCLCRSAWSGIWPYVLDARGGGSITGYRLSGRTLVPLPGSTRSLGLADNGNPEFLQTPAQVAITPDQSAVVVTTKTHGALLTFPLDRTGQPDSAPVSTASGAVPFALSFDRSGHLLVVDATGLVTSYRVRSSGAVEQLSQVGPTGQNASCWSVLVRGTCTWPMQARTASPRSATASVGSPCRHRSPPPRTADRSTWRPLAMAGTSTS